MKMLSFESKFKFWIRFQQILGEILHFLYKTTDFVFWPKKDYIHKNPFFSNTICQSFL